MISPMAAEPGNIRKNNISLHYTNRQVFVLFENCMSNIFFISITFSYNFSLRSIGVLRGGGDARFALVIESIIMWFIGVPLTFLGAFYLKLPVYYVVMLTSAEEITKFMFCIMRAKSGKWIRNVIHNMA